MVNLVTYIRVMFGNHNFDQNELSGLVVINLANL